MKTLILLAATLLWVTAPAARAQDNAWVQIEALRTLAEAESRARAYSNAFRNVNGFRVPGGWYAIALGPYTRATASSELAALKRERLIPADSYLAFSSQYRQQFWPVGASTLSAAPVDPQADTLTAALPEPAAEAAPEAAAPTPPPYVADETPRQARAGEALLDPAARRLLQEALQWEGFYNAAIDGSFGQGTRNAMAAWQRAKGYDATGILTTRQRQELTGGYRALFDNLGLTPIRDTNAGIEILMPAGKVAYARTEAPFLHYDATDDDGVRVVLISQSGDEATLFGLYDIMQTLEIVPLTGERNRQRRSFVLTGQSDDLHSYTHARLVDGAVKGFTLAWKPGNEKLMNRVAAMMLESFTPIDGVVLPDTAISGDGSDQRIDLLSGLERRRPERSRTGFYVDGLGAVLTTTDVLDSCSRVTIGEEIDAEVAARDDTLGLALLKPGTMLAPLAVAQFRSSLPRLNSEIAVAGFPYGDVLDLPVITYGSLSDIRGLQGEDDLDRLALSARPGDAGGPVFDQSGAVVGMLRPRQDTGDQRLPEDVNFAIDVQAIAGFLGDVGLSPLSAEVRDDIAPEDLATLAGDVAVRVSCWN